MDENEHKLPRPGMMPPLPPGMMPKVPNLPQQAPLGRPGMQPSFPGAQLPSMPQSFTAPAPQPYKDPGPSAETVRMTEEKDKLEKKISEMEKNLAQEKEKSLMAALKSQQDEALSSRVESSLKDIQEKMRRDRRDSQVEEERITLKGKIKEMESRLAQERETWMQTLKNQLSERETQGKDVESHFIYRLQEMERRWLDEKAQWQKQVSGNEETIRSLRTAGEKLRDLADEYRKLSMEKSMMEREASKLRDEVARAEREKASIESYIKIIPEKERELAETRAENSILRMREDKLTQDSKRQEEKQTTKAAYRDRQHADEMAKQQAEITKLNGEIASMSDRKNAEKSEEIKKIEAAFDSQLQEKEKALAEVAGDKMRAISELLKIKGFVSRVQAINAAMDKERGQLRLDKMQLAQTMAAQLEEIKKCRQEVEGSRAATQVECDKVRVESEKVKAEYGAEMARMHQDELARMAGAHQAETRKLSTMHEAELIKLSAQHQSDLDAKMFQMRMKYDTSVEENKIALKRQLEEDYGKQIKEARIAALAADGARASQETEMRRLSGALSYAEAALVAKQKEFEERVAKLETELKRQETQGANLFAQKTELEKRMSAASVDQAGMIAQQSSLSASKNALENELAALKENFRLESENRSRFESEMLFLKQKIQQMDFQANENAAALEAERSSAAARDAEARARLDNDSARASELSAQLDSYRKMEQSLGDRLKWAIKGGKVS